VTYPRFTAEELAKNVEDIYLDKRYDTVFTYLVRPLFVAVSPSISLLIYFLLTIDFYFCCFDVIADHR